MKKITILSLISALSYGSFASAGGMGGAATPCCSPFIALEGGYSWNKIGGYDFAIIGANSTVTSITKNTAGTGRLAAGMVSMIDDQWGFTGELGWGYYGRTTLNRDTSGITTALADLSLSHTLTGFDALVGVLWTQSCFNLSLKAGALIQNNYSKSIGTFDPLGLPIIDALEVKSNSTAVLPEIKFGAGYSFNPNWAITVAYMYAYFGSPKTTGALDINTLRATLNINTQNPTVSAALVGVQYTI